LFPVEQGCDGVAMTTVQAIQVRDIDEEIGYGILLEKMRKIKTGCAYALEEPNREHAFKLLNDCVKNGYSKKFSGHKVYTRMKPSILNELNIFKKEDTRWFTSNLDKNETCLSPTDLPKISSTMLEDIKGEKAIFVEGVEYLAFQNGFEAMLRLKEYVYDHISGSKAAIIWNYDPLAFDQKQARLFKKNSKDVHEL